MSDSLWMSHEQCKEKESECRNMSKHKNLTPQQRVSLMHMAERWARLAAQANSQEER